MDELLQYDVCTVSPLFEEIGLEAMSVKSELRDLSPDCIKHPKHGPLESCYITDVMAKLWNFQSRNFKHFSDLGN